MILRIETRQSEGPSRCVFCHDGPGDDVLHSCGACGATAHRPCRAEASKCATIGCAPTAASQVKERTCGSCGLPDKDGLVFDTTWLEVTLGLLCRSCILRGVPDRMYRERQRQQRANEPDEFMRAMALLGVCAAVSPFILFFAFWLLGVFKH